MDEDRREGFAYHADLVQRMAARQGVNLSEALEADQLSFSGLDDAVHRCMQCSDPQRCQSWLESGGDGKNIPEFCRNHALFQRLR